MNNLTAITYIQRVKPLNYTPLSPLLYSLPIPISSQAYHHSPLLSFVTIHYTETVHKTEHSSKHTIV